VRILRSLVAAIAFFTRIPTGGRAFPSDLPAALPWLPAIGLFLGGAASMIAMASTCASTTSTTPITPYAPVCGSFMMR